MSGYPKGDRFFCVLFGAYSGVTAGGVGFYYLFPKYIQQFNIQQQLLLSNLFVYPNFAEEKYLKKLLSVIRCENIFHTFVMQGVILRQADIFYESVFIVLDKKSGKFQSMK